MITLEQAKALRSGDMLYHVTNRNYDGTPQRWKVNGAPQTWKRTPGRVRVPLRHGMYAYGQLTETHLHLVCLKESEAMG